MVNIFCGFMESNQEPSAPISNFATWGPRATKQVYGIRRGCKSQTHVTNEQGKIRKNRRNLYKNPFAYVGLLKDILNPWGKED